MTGPENGRGGDAFDDFFGDPTPSGRMGPVPEQPRAQEPQDEPTREVEQPPLDEETTQPAAPLPPIVPEPTPQGAVPDDWWTPEPTPEQTPVAAPSSTWQDQPTPPPPAYGNQPYGAPPQPPAHQAPRRGVSPAATVGLLVGGVLLGGLCVGGAIMVTADDDEPVAQQTVTQTSTPESTSSSTSTPPPTSSSSPSSSSSATRTGKLPDGVKKCSGPKQGTSVGRGTDVTSCAFASAVRDAYLAKDPDGSTTLEVRSPVTKKNYSMKCTGESVTRCTGGNDAVVVLY